MAIIDLLMLVRLAEKHMANTMAASAVGGAQKAGGEVIGF